MIKFPTRLLAAIAFAGATALLNVPAAFAQSPFVFTPGTALVYSAQRGMMQMGVNQSSHDAMMKHAKKLPPNTVIFMNNGSIYMATGELDPGGNFTGRY